jgi:hypothetical protein
LFLSFQVSEPGSPGAGITYLRQAGIAPLNVEKRDAALLALSR